VTGPTPPRATGPAEAAGGPGTADRAECAGGRSAPDGGTIAGMTEESDPPAAPEGGQTTDVTPGPGGVMTDEVGVVTGPLTLRTTVDGSEVVVHVQYKDADEWYRVTGARATLADPEDAAAVHKIVVGVLDRPEG
jgi:hypothetical protein